MLSIEEKITMLERDIESHSNRIAELNDMLNVAKMQQKQTIPQDVTLTNHAGTLILG